MTTRLDLDAIERRASDASGWYAREDVPALLVEVRLLREAMARVERHVDLMETMSSPYAGDPFKVRADAVLMMRGALAQRSDAALSPHQYRIRDEDYALAMRAADERQENLSEEVRKFVIKYGRKHAKKDGQS